MTVAVVDPEKCTGCGLCVDLCPHKGAVEISEWKSRINETVCGGCGVCVGACPGLALNIKYLTREQILARMRVLLKSMQYGREFEPKILIFACDWLSRKGADLTYVSKAPHSSNVRATKFPCIGSVDPILILNAFLSGVDGVLLVGCGPEDCEHIGGNLNAESRGRYASMTLEHLGIGSERLRVELIPLSSARERFLEAVRGTIEIVRDIGLSPPSEPKAHH